MEGPGLVFAAFSQATSLLPSASLWAIIFFLVLIFMGLSTLMKILESIAFPFQNSIFGQQPLLLSGTVDSHSSENPALPTPGGPRPRGSLRPLTQPYALTSVRPNPPLP